MKGAKPVELAVRERRQGTTRLVNLNSALTDVYNIHRSNNPGLWSGGACFGDSGGPVFLVTSTTIVAVNSFVNNDNCKGASYGYRIDRAGSLAFRNQQLTATARQSQHRSLRDLFY